MALLRPSRSCRRANKNSKAGRVPPSMDGDEYTLSSLEEDIVVHESWWRCGLWATDCCGRGHGGEVGTTGRCGCGGGCCLLSAACLPTGARNACPNRCLCLGRRTIRRRAPHWPFGAAIDLEIFRYPLCIRPQPLRCRSWGSAIMRANSGPPPRRPRLQGGALQEHHPWPRWSLQPDKLWIDLLLFHWPQAGYKAFCAEWS